MGRPMGDIRSHRRYAAAARAWLPSQAGRPCCLCGCGIDPGLPATHPYGATVEHTLPVRVIVAQARSRADALDMVCDTRLWDVAHRVCQARQGQRASIESRHPVVVGASRAW